MDVWFLNLPVVAYFGAVAATARNNPVLNKDQ